MTYIPSPNLFQTQTNLFPKSDSITSLRLQSQISPWPSIQIQSQAFSSIHKTSYLTLLVNSNRFADTIPKAQEKTTGKGEKQDPERLRLEKLELEKRRRAEKARLQAEAKAVEEARRKAEAEAEAATEAKRKREVEREAARQALQRVDIDENAQFLEDLELLQAAPMEPLIDEISPVHSLDPFGSFKFQGNSNPMELLGLYMKDDDEEVKPEALIDDPEEGEIDGFSSFHDV